MSIGVRPVLKMLKEEGGLLPLCRLFGLLHFVDCIYFEGFLNTIQVLVECAITLLCSR